MSARGKKAAAKGVDIMIRHILFWNYTDNVKAQHKEEETLKFLQNSVDTMNGHIDGLINAALKSFQTHPLHMAHKQRCAELVTDRLCGDLIVDL